MKKLSCLLMIGVMLCLAGCSGKENTEHSQGEPTEGGEREPSKGVSTTFTAKDYNQDEESIWKTDKGYYYYSYAHGGFRYIDTATGKEMYLCNKPECRHDGNAFCVATNDKYIVLGGRLYDGRIVANVVEETDTQYLYKLLEIAADGSMANEIVTYYVLEKSGVGQAVLHGGGSLYIHRNKVLLPFAAGGVSHLEDAEYYGCAIVDLNTKEVEYLDEEPFGKDNAEVTNVDAFGDYFYYCRQEGKKMVLYRYNIKDGSAESHKLLVGFRGKYIVPDEEHVVYLKSAGRELCVHTYGTGENEEKLKLMGTKTFYMTDGTEFESEEAYTAVGLQTDGDYYYVAEQSYTINHGVVEDGEEEKKTDYARVYVYNRAFELVTVINLADIRKELRPEGEESFYGAHTDLRIIGDTVYWPLSNGVDTQYMFSCKKSDFLAGTPKFEQEYVTGR